MSLDETRPAPRPAQSREDFEARLRAIGAER